MISLGLITQRVLRVADNGALTFDGANAPGTVGRNRAVTVATLLQGQNGVLWGAMNDDPFVLMGDGIGGHDQNVLPAFAAISMTSGDVDGDGDEELLGVDASGFVAVFEQVNLGTWSQYDGNFSFVGDTGALNSRCALIDVGDSPRPELVCVANDRVRIASLRPRAEQCDSGDPFGAPCTTQCVIGQGP